MNKGLLASGIVLIFLGVLFMSYSNTAQEKPMMDAYVKALVGTPAKNDPNEWYVKGWVNQGEKIILQFIYESWKEMFPNGGLFPTNFSITDPNGKKAIFQVDFRYISYPPPGTVAHEPPILLEKDDGIALSIADPPGVVGGNATMSGNYTARVEGGIPFVVGSFDSLRLERAWIVMEYPHSYLLFPGIAASVSGLALVVYASRKPPRKRVLIKGHKP